MARRYSLAVAVGLAAISVAAAAAAAPGAVANSGRPDAASAGANDLAPALVSAVAHDFDLSTAQAQARLTGERSAARVDKAVRDTLGSRYAGSWLSDGKLNVAVTDAASAELARRAGAWTTVVSRDLGQLEAAQARLDAAAQLSAPAGVPGWYVDVASNAVVVLVRPGAQPAANRFVAASGADPATIRYVASAEAPRTLIDIIGGNAYFIGSGTRCSVGFSVGGGFVTAGHCGRTGARTSQPGGSFAGSSFPGNDYAWVRADPGNTPRALVNGYGAGNLPVRGSAQAPIGATVCRSGSTTGRHCGIVQAYNATVTYPQGTVTGLIRTSVCAEPGDSGGSLLWNDQAQGVTSGGSGNCTGGGTTFFQPVSEILQVFGLQLATAGGTPPTSPPGPSPSAPGGTTWAPFTAYGIGAQVTYAGIRYQCIQGHTSLPGWEPPSTPAIWAQV